MMKKGRSLIKSYMTMEYNFTGIRVQDTALIPVDWTLKANLVATHKKGKTKEETEQNATLAYQKINFWLETNLESVIIVDINNEDDVYIANLSSNIMMFCPGHPSDDMIIQLLHAKISALAGNAIVVGEMHLHSSDTSLQYTYDCPDDGYKLPTTNESLYTTGKARSNIPWWFRDDGFCFEFVLPDNPSVNVEEILKDVVDPMDEFHRIIDEMDSQLGIVKEPARIVQVEKWKPKTI